MLFVGVRYELVHLRSLETLNRESKIKINAILVKAIKTTAKSNTKLVSKGFFPQFRASEIHTQPTPTEDKLTVKKLQIMSENKLSMKEYWVDV